MCQKSTAHEQRRSRGESRKLRFGLNRTAPKIWQEGQHVHDMYMIFTVHLNRLIDENTPLEQSTIETCLQEAYKYQKVTKISCDIWSRFEASWLDCVTMMSEMTIAVIVVSASCHHLTRADSGWSRISWFSRVTLPWLRGGTSVAPWRHKSSHVPVFRRLFDRLPLEFRPRTFTIGFYGKNIISELMILECSFPLMRESAKELVYRGENWCDKTGWSAKTNMVSWFYSLVSFHFS